VHVVNKLLERLGAAFDQLSAREQVMVFGLVLAILAMMVGFGGYFVGRDLDRRRLRIDNKLAKLEQVASLRSDYQRRLAEQRRLATEVRNNSRLRILSYIESLSAKANIELENASERRGEATGSDQVVEEAAVVELRSVSIDRLDAFLRSVEQGNRLVKVRRLKVKKRFDDPKMLDATITVGTFKPAEGQ
jgi:type II secretory pathway component PulM